MKCKACNTLDAIEGEDFCEVCKKEIQQDYEEMDGKIKHQREEFEMINEKEFLESILGSLYGQSSVTFDNNFIIFGVKKFDEITTKIEERIEELVKKGINK